MSTHNQPQKKQETHNQPRARAVTLRAASPVLLMQLWSHSAAVAAAAAPKHRANLERDEEVTMSLTHLDSTLACIVSSTTLDSPARNSALTLRCPRGRPREGGVLSWARPGP